MSGCFAFEGNAYLDSSYIINSTTSSSILTTSAITMSSIDMLSSIGNYQNITNVKMPIQDHDAVIKLYVDNLGIVINDVTLNETQGTSITTNNKGSYVVTITNLVNNGPSATFHITKNDITTCGHIARVTACSGTNSTCLLNILWPSYSTPQLFKTSSEYDGSYRIKII